MTSETKKSISTPATATSHFADRVLAWYDEHGRKHLPWQQSPTLYKTWVSEIMLQQTQVATVIPYFNRFMDSFPTVVDLANANEDAVLNHWSGLGYYARARNLHNAAKTIRDDYAGEFPKRFDDVLALSGVGRSTAGAILSLALNQRHAMLDGNVKRVLARHQMVKGHSSQKQAENTLWAIAEANTPNARNRAYTQAMMDLGALVCTRTKPKCDQCPIYTDCQARIHDKIADFPNKKPKKAKPERRTIMVIAVFDNYVLMEKRPSKGIWGGLYALPMFDTATDVSDIFGGDGDEWTQIKHVFTHFTLHITPKFIQLAKMREFGHYVWLTKDEINEVGLPKPVQTLLEMLDESFYKNP